MDEKVDIPAESWQVSRQAAIELAIERDDLPALRKWSVEPGGFGNAATRQKAWSHLLQPHSARSRRDEGSATAFPAPAETANLVLATATSLDKLVEDAFVIETPPLAHSDEGQVLLDTKRSFVYYPENMSPREKLRLQGELNDLIVTVLRRRRGLSYFQGYHDIISILYLTFFPYQNEEPLRRRSASPRQTRSRKSSKASETRPAGVVEGRRGSVDRLALARTASASPLVAQSGPLPELGQVGEERTSRQSSGQSTPVGELAGAGPPSGRKQDTKQWKRLVDCCDAVSLLKVRDAMGHTLAPSIGYLRLFKRLIKATDPDLAKLVLAVSPTPYFALSWLLTVFSHDLNVLEPTQRIFDFFISRNPAIMIYLGVAIIMLKRKTLLELKDTLETDPGILHSYLSRLPPLIADNPAGQEEVISIEEIPEKSAASGHDYLEPGGPNPLEAVRLSELFSLTDTLWARFPLDHSAIRAQEILAPKSVVFTDSDAGPSFTLEDAGILVGEAGFEEDEVVVTPALPETDDEEEETPRASRTSRRRTSIADVLGSRHSQVAIAVLVVGVSVALYNSRRQGRPHSLMLDILRARFAAEMGIIGAYIRDQRSSAIWTIARTRAEEAIKQMTRLTTR